MQQKSQFLLVLNSVHLFLTTGLLVIWQADFALSGAIHSFCERVSGDKDVDELKIGGFFCRLLCARPDVGQRRNSQEKRFTFFQNRGMYMTRLQNLLRRLFVQSYSSYEFFSIIIINAWFVNWVFEMEFPWGKRKGMLSWYIAIKKYA